MKVIGITGGSGTGKSTVLRMFERLGAYTIDADQIYHRQLASNKDLINEIMLRFPGVVKDGAIDRKRLGKLVFNNKSDMEALNEITHKYVLKKIKDTLKTAEEGNVRITVIDAILIIETELHQYCDYIIGVTASQEVRAQRISTRDGIDIEYALERISAQKDDSFYKEHCDFIIENNGKVKNIDSIIAGIFDDVTQNRVQRRTTNGKTEN